jgi:hypothetical protein
MQQFSGKEVPLVPGGLRGYREWIVGTLGLRASNFNYFWKPGINVADCRATDLDFPEEGHKAPDAGCTCGLYARYRWDRVSAHGGWNGTAVGVIEASGRVILGTQGFRAEKAKIVALCIEDDIYKHPPLDPSIQFFDRIPDMLEAFPPQDVSELIGPQEPVMPQIRIMVVAPPDTEAINWMAGTPFWNVMDPDVIVYVEGGPTLYRGPRSGIKEIKYEDGQVRVISSE